MKHTTVDPGMLEKKIIGNQKFVVKTCWTSDILNPELHAITWTPDALSLNLELHNMDTRRYQFDFNQLSYPFDIFSAMLIASVVKSAQIDVA